MIKRRYFFALPAFCLFATTAPLLAQGGAAPVNDHCGDVTPQALAVESTLTFTGNTVGATIDGDNVPGSGLDDFNVAVVWVAFTTTQCANVAVSYCGSTTPFLDQYFWNVIGPDCPMDEVIVTDDYNNSECADGQPVVHFAELPPGTYYYPVWADQAGPTGDYIITVSATACADQGPENDFCSGAMGHTIAPEASLSITGDNTGATDGEGLGYAGVWESFTLSQCSNVTVDYCGTTGFSAFAYGLYADCPATTLIDTTASDTCTDGNLSETFIGLAPGTYWIPVKMVADSAEGAYAINVTTTACVGPANNYCNGAEAHDLALEDTLEIVGDNTGATDNEGLGFAGVWESFSIAECANVTVDYCGTSGFNAFAQGLYADCPVNTLINTTVADTCANGNLSETFEALAPGTYWIPVRMVADSAEGEYAITVTASACTVEVPMNDLCAGAETIDVVTPTACDTAAVEGDNTGATGSADAPACGTPGEAWQDVWFTFDSGDNGQVVITMTPGTINGAGMEVFASCGDTAIACSIDGSAITLPVAADTSYVVRVFTQGPEGTPGTFMLCITGDHSTGVPAINGNELRIFPNPSDGNFSLVPQHSTSDAVITLLDMTGRTVHVEHARLHDGEVYNLSVAGTLKPGTYVLQLATPEGTSVQRLMVK